MKNILRSSLTLLCLIAASPWILADPAPQPVLPASLEVPANQKLALVLKAKGMQIYQCRATAADPAKYEWVFKAPEADLFDAQGHKVGHHFAGPTWELTDGGKVGGRLKAKAEAPDGKGVAWLLLEAVDPSGPVLGKVQSIQRVDTVGGKAPSTPAGSNTVGQEARVDYTATYKFYVANP